MYLVYDTYYACPRSYLVGKCPNGSHLTPDEMMQDIQQDYIDKTETLERHPYDPTS
jgi:ubiquitin-like-conjugating enzyme ATG3